MHGTLSPVILQFRDAHHTVAKLFAAGMHPSMISRKTGYSQRRLNLLYRDRAFQELIATYSERIQENLVEEIDEYMELGVGNMLQAERQIREKLESAEISGETLPTRELIAIASDRADRFGYSKHSRVSVDHSFANALDQAIQRSGKADAIRALNAKQIEGQVVSSPKAADLPGPSVPLPQEQSLVSPAPPDAGSVPARPMAAPPLMRRI